MKDIVFETERMILRKLTLEDIGNLMLIFSNPIAMQYYPRLYNEKDARDWIERAQTNYRKYNAGMWACHLKQTGEFVGLCGLHYHPDIDGQEEFEIGYLFVRKFWHQGLATEAAKACEKHLKEKGLFPSFVRRTNLPRGLPNAMA